MSSACKQYAISIWPPLAIFLKKKKTCTHTHSLLPSVVCSKVPHVHLDHQLLGKLQRKSVAAMSCFSGYECEALFMMSMTPPDGTVSAGASPEALGILSDLLGSFLSNFTRFLKMNADRHATSCSGPGGGGGGGGCLGFQDALERSLQQVGMGGRSGLHQYWRSAVQGSVRRLEAEADEYKNTYLTLTVSSERVSLTKHCSLALLGA